MAYNNPPFRDGKKSIPLFPPYPALLEHVSGSLVESIPLAREENATIVLGTVLGHENETDAGSQLRTTSTEP